MIINVFCSASAKEIKNVRAWLLPSLEKQTFEGNINLYIINYNSDSGIVKFDINKNDRLKIFELSPPNRVGFGEAHNFAFDNVNPEKMFLIVNPDVYLTKNCIANLINKMEQSKDTAIVEARQLPFEHPKEYDPATGETPWASGFCCLIDSTFFKKVGGFDPNFWMYCEDVDLSWKAWANGYKVIYSPESVAYHFTGVHSYYNSTRYYIENFWSARNFLVLSYKYWGQSGLKKSIRLLKKTKYPEVFKNEVINSFETVKNKINRDGIKNIKLSTIKQIKITGFNLYHELRD